MHWQAGSLPLAPPVMPVYIYTLYLINTRYYQILKLQGKGAGFYLFI